jgi:hypothetical protein
MYTVDTSTNTSIVYGYKVLVVIRAGLLLQVVYLVAIIKVKLEEVFSAIGVINVL